MKDAFGKKINVGDKVICSTSNSGGTIYNFGEIVKLHPHKADNNKSYCPPDRVSIKIIKSTSSWVKFEKDPILYASNVVLIPFDYNKI